MTIGTLHANQRTHNDHPRPTRAGHNKTLFPKRNNSSEILIIVLKIMKNVMNGLAESVDRNRGQ